MPAKSPPAPQPVQAEPYEIADAAGLDALYPAPLETSLVKETDRIVPEYRAFIEAAPFLVIASAGGHGLDVSPRGDPAGFVRVVDPKTLDLPDRRGNNRIDTLRNIVIDPRVALIFLVPGVGETIRVRGRARILVDPALNAAHAINDKPATCVIRIAVARAYFQCQKAIKRSRLWDPDVRIDRTHLPTAGDILAALSEGRVGGQAYDGDYPARMARTIY